MIWQLRTYRIRAGSMAEFRQVWSHHVVPSQIRAGFEVKGGWYDADDDTFVWMVGLAEDKQWREMEDSYYADPERPKWPSRCPTG